MYSYCILKLSCFLESVWYQQQSGTHFRFEEIVSVIKMAFFHNHYLQFAMAVVIYSFQMFQQKKT